MISYSKWKNAVLNPSTSFLALKKVNPRILLTFKISFSKKMGKTPSSHIICCVQIFFWDLQSQISQVLSRLDFSLSLSDNVTLRKSSKRVQCSNAFIIHRHASVGGSLCTAASFPFREERGPLYSVLAAEFQSPLGESNSSTKYHRRHRLTLRE